MVTTMTVTVVAAAGGPAEGWMIAHASAVASQVTSLVIAPLVIHIRQIDTLSRDTELPVRVGMQRTFGGLLRTPTTGPSSSVTMPTATPTVLTTVSSIDMGAVGSEHRITMRMVATRAADTRANRGIGGKPCRAAQPTLSALTSTGCVRSNSMSQDCHAGRLMCSPPICKSSPSGIICSIIR